MQQLFKTERRKTVMKLLLLALIAKAVMTAAMYFLPRIGVDVVHVPQVSLYGSYKPSRVLRLNRPAKKPQQKKIPVYKLDKLILKATYAAAVAPFIVVEDNRKTVLVSRGGVYKGYKLIEVHPDRAVFEKGGRHYEIRFKESKVKGSSITQAAPEIINEGEAVFIKRNEIRHYARHYDDIWKNVKIKEIIKNRHLQGFRVTWVKKGSVFEKVGLRKGDIIIGANDKKFKSLSQVFKLYNNMDKIDSMKLTIIRDNEERELEYEIFE